ncbi:hypothetical protein PUNSTDRAFT_52124 [Punctularia strigosozonata HHB-11173 SS5]|uniref:uncharacterized protein n=1 Tax=Punctularia strigosozonata (strain HHB-11173) TaxID=741275 RepID=UPI000441811A|nr:uncharacterized protein PUNSTDRAFT_52124 [Punctularia strigosozonata HHB-11173 SS5]EIN10026.1 hypothetical protein PUNSTDRAFT_52124 [Punctularia strigosozonata HHB-11173 SS5]
MGQWARSFASKRMKCVYRGHERERRPNVNADHSTSPVPALRVPETSPPNNECVWSYMRMHML